MPALSAVVGPHSPASSPFKVPEWSCLHYIDVGLSCAVICPDLHPTFAI